MKYIAKLIILPVSVLLLSTQTNATIIEGECDATILAPGKTIHTHYHDNKYHLTSLSCKKFGKNKDSKKVKHQGKKCANSRIDGCSLSWTDKLFTKRDKRLMTPSCNAHDLCYSTKGISKDSCDKELKKNLQATKDKFNGGYDIDVIMKGVYLKGQDGYDSGQTWGKKNGCKK